MPETYPAFQNDGAFQVAEDAGFQTQLVEVVVPPPGGGVGIVVVVRPRPRGRRWHVHIQLAAVVTLDASTSTSTAIGRDDDEVVELLAAGGLGRVALVHEHDDEEAILGLLVTLGTRRALMWRNDDAAAWLEEDER